MVIDILAGKTYHILQCHLILSSLRSAGAAIFRSIFIFCQAKPGHNRGERKERSVPLTGQRHPLPGHSGLSMCFIVPRCALLPLPYCPSEVEHLRGPSLTRIRDLKYIPRCFAYHSTPLDSRSATPWICTDPVPAPCVRIWDFPVVDCCMPVWLVYII